MAGGRVSTITAYGVFRSPGNHHPVCFTPTEYGAEFARDLMGASHVTPCELPAAWFAERGYDYSWEQEADAAARGDGACEKRRSDAPGAFQVVSMPHLDASDALAAPWCRTAWKFRSRARSRLRFEPSRRFYPAPQNRGRENTGGSTMVVTRNPAPHGACRTERAP